MLLVEAVFVLPRTLALQLPVLGVWSLNSRNPPLTVKRVLHMRPFRRGISNQNTPDFHFEKCPEMHTFAGKNDHSVVQPVPLGKPSFLVSETTRNLRSPWPATRKLHLHKGSGPFTGSQPENAPNPWWHHFSLNEKLEMPPIPNDRH